MTKAEKVYTGLCGLFSIFIVLSNLTYQKFVVLPILPFHTFEISVGAILYPLTFLLTDLITEFYNKERANFCVKFAIIINIVVAGILMFMDSLTATEWSKLDNDTFHNVFGFYSVAFIGSILACYVSQAFDIIFYLWIRKITSGKYLWLRSSGSTSISLLIDTSIVISVMSLFGILPPEQILPLIGNSYSWKLFFTVSMIPVFYGLVGIMRFTLTGKKIRIQTDPISTTTSI